MTTFNHGDAHRGKQTRLYRIWCGIRTRCTNPNFPAYIHYGGRGIALCKEWSDYRVFKEWSIGNGYEEKLTIDRIDNEGNYSPENCQWTTFYKQARNKRNNRLITAFGETKKMVDWPDDPRCKTDYLNLKNRIHQEWDSERAITQPTDVVAKPKKRMVTKDGRTQSVHAWCKELGINPGCIYLRIYRGITGDDLFLPRKTTTLPD